MVSNNWKIFCKHVKKATIHISRRSNFKILRGSKVIDVTSYPSFLVMLSGVGDILEWGLINFCKNTNKIVE